MMVYIVLCEEWNGTGVVTSVDEVFFDEEKAEAYTKEMNKQYASFYHYFLKREVKE